jgi:hypothetical protein
MPLRTASRHWSKEPDTLISATSGLLFGRVLPLRSEKHAGGPFKYGRRQPYPVTLTTMTPPRSKAGQLTRPSHAHPE